MGSRSVGELSFFVIFLVFLAFSFRLVSWRVKETLAILHACVAHAVPSNCDQIGGRGGVVRWITVLGNSLSRACCWLQFG